eukprot:NODE_26470_length_549_cov_7.450237.p1 GENE.NODE_26470_length_549_cov_7.450237~~NODE_26470_length_549_cov_7.450237.p1  ORF type:complete len:155 (+),score=23.47 NODE_26470_length_549_cov_7.450237:23-466(+)
MGLCAVSPSCIWVICMFSFVIWGGHCDGTKGHILSFIWGSIFSFLLIVGMGIYNGLYAGEPDFHCSLRDKITFGITLGVIIFLIFWNYWGCYTIVAGESCSHHLKTRGWVTLCFNNIVIFCVGTTSILGFTGQFLTSGSDLAADDRL